MKNWQRTILLSRTFQAMCQQFSLFRSSFCAVFMRGPFKDTRRTAGLGLARSVLDLGQNGHHLYQSPAQPRTRENDAANNIITALVHISLIWQKPSLSSVSHMVQCFIIGGVGSTTDRMLHSSLPCDLKLLTLSQ